MSSLCCLSRAGTFGSGTSAPFASPSLLTSHSQLCTSTVVLCCRQLPAFQVQLLFAHHHSLSCRSFILLSFCYTRRQYCTAAFILYHNRRGKHNSSIYPNRHSASERAAPPTGKEQHIVRTGRQHRTQVGEKLHPGVIRRATAYTRHHACPPNSPRNHRNHSSDSNRLENPRLTTTPPTPEQWPTSNSLVLPTRRTRSRRRRWHSPRQFSRFPAANLALLVPQQRRRLHSRQQL